MQNRLIDKRVALPGSIICENNAVRLRVVRHGVSLGVMLEAEDPEGNRVLLLHEPDDTGVPMAVTTRGAASYRYVSFDPIEIHGETRGVRLVGFLDDNEVSLTAFLSNQGAWGHFLFDAGKLRANISRLIHRWHIAEDAFTPDVSWPHAPVYQQALTTNPAAFFQMGPLFSALVADMEEGVTRQLGLTLLSPDCAGFEFGILSPDAFPSALEQPTRFAYAICLDAHAVPAFGYQQLLRFLGNHEALPPIPGEIAHPVSGTLPPLPTVPDDSQWLPFVHEGDPAEIAALIRHHLRMAGHKDWYLLERALQWLDRLCLHQRLCEVPGGGQYGGFGDGPAWHTTAVWMPHLLLEAFRLTGNPEYAYRGMAAISALPPRQQALVLGNLHPQFGDIFINADHGAAVLFTHLSHFHSEMTPNGIILEVADASHRHPLQLVMEGTHDCYQVEINGKALGFLPTTLLRQGIELPA